MQNDIRWQQRFSNYQKALEQLRKFIDHGELNELEEQGLIQAFEYTHELAWNVLRDYLLCKGHQAIHGSRDASREAFKLELIDDGECWMDMIRDRNRTVHTPDPETALAIVGNIRERFFAQFERLAQTVAGLVDAE
ncbi:MAG: nucleotidyltransferase substrate binding protein [Methylomonas sp.]|nr:nucleotidyltransferase substrate binding protein [Methylomonas sp.]